mmetsp:Transcript_36077/g.88795  ORF Transcript_36077/g.88795 Transcript_36077/m.88795 type:complete len:119 (-) Transcript_36077:51-407(-)
MHTRSRKRGPLDAGGGDGPCALLLANRAHALYSSSALAGEPPLAGESSFLGGGERESRLGESLRGESRRGERESFLGGGDLSLSRLGEPDLERPRRGDLESSRSRRRGGDRLLPLPPP